MTIRAKTSQEASGRFNEDSEMFSPCSLDTQGAEEVHWDEDMDNLSVAILSAVAIAFFCIGFGTALLAWQQEWI